MKYVIVFVLGFVSHKVFNYIYDYSFQKGFSSSACRDQYGLDVKDPKIDGPLTKRFECTYKQMGVVENLKYILVRPSVMPGQKDWIF